MERLLIFALIVVLFLAAAVIAYTVVTNKIIKDQEREIEILKTDNERLRSAIRGARYVENLRLSKEPVEPSVTFTVINPKGKKVLEDLFEEW